MNQLGDALQVNKPTFWGGGFFLQPGGVGGVDKGALESSSLPVSSTLMSLPGLPSHHPPPAPTCTVSPPTEDHPARLFMSVHAVAVSSQRWMGLPGGRGCGHEEKALGSPSDRMTH